MQHEVTQKQKLLDENGNIKEPGYAKTQVWQYSREDIKAPKWRIKEWDYYYIGNQEYGLCLTISDAGYVSCISASLLDFKNKTDCLYLPYDKWLILLCRYADHPDKVNELIEIAKEIFPNCKKVTIKRESLRNADISNQDKYTISDWLEQSNVSIKEFISNPAYIIFISYNRIFEDLITSGLLNVNFIEDYCDSFSFDE